MKYNLGTCVVAQLIPRKCPVLFMPPPLAQTHKCLDSLRGIKKPRLVGVVLQLCIAERKGFEPSKQFPVYTLSRRAPSTTRTPLCLLWGCKYKRKIPNQPLNIAAALAVVILANSATVIPLAPANTSAICIK